MDYTIINSAFRDEFIQKINEKLQEGWELYGPLILSANMFCREMVKGDELLVDDKEQA